MKKKGSVTFAQDPAEEYTSKAASALQQSDLEFKSSELPISQYVEGVCNNKKLSREIRETLQILVMKERSGIEHILNKEPKECERCMKAQDETMDDQGEISFLGKFSFSFLEEQLANMTNLKDILQQQLEEEYANNEELRKENKDLSDELFLFKEKHCKVVLQNQEYKTRVEKLDTIKEWLQQTNQDILRTSLRNIKGKAELQQLIEESTKGKLQFNV